MPNLWIYSPLSGMGGGALHWDALSVNPMSGGGGGGLEIGMPYLRFLFTLEGYGGLGGEGSVLGCLICGISFSPLSGWVGVGGGGGSALSVNPLSEDGGGEGWGWALN